MLESLKLTLFRKRMTQAELARRVGVSDTHISRLILGQARCRAALRRRIAEILGVPEGVLFPGRRRIRRRATRNQCEDAAGK